MGMTRPLYETGADRQNERAVARALEKRWGYVAYKLKPACEMDYALTRDGVVVAVMEIKCRKYPYKTIDEWGGLILSAHKWQAAMRWKDTHSIAFILALGLPDGLYVLSVLKGDKPPYINLIMGGRTDRNDPQDTEPCVLIPMSMFKMIKDDSGTHAEVKNPRKPGEID
jgi:hypothetical protein